MNHESSEQLLKNLCQHLREGDERSAPSFAFLLSRAIQRKPTIQRLPLVLSLAGASACVAVVSIALLSHMLSSSDEEFFRTLQMGKSLTNWKAPTDVLLQPPHKGLLRGIPKLGETFLDMKIKVE